MADRGSAALQPFNPLSITIKRRETEDGIAIVLVAPEIEHAKVMVFVQPGEKQEMALQQAENLIERTLEFATQSQLLYRVMAGEASEA